MEPKGTAAAGGRDEWGKSEHKKKRKKIHLSPRRERVRNFGSQLAKGIPLPQPFHELVPPRNFVSISVLLAIIMHQKAPFRAAKERISGVGSMWVPVPVPVSPLLLSDPPRGAHLAHIRRCP